VEEMFKGDSAETPAKNFRLWRCGDERTRQACADGERGPPSARAEIFLFFFLLSAWVTFLPEKNVIPTSISLYMLYT
jgi:hypothetical protein